MFVSVINMLFDREIQIFIQSMHRRS